MTVPSRAPLDRLHFPLPCPPRTELGERRGIRSQAETSEVGSDETWGSFLTPPSSSVGSVSPLRFRSEFPSTPLVTTPCRLPGRACLPSPLVTPPPFPHVPLLILLWTPFLRPWSVPESVILRPVPSFTPLAPSWASLLSFLPPPFISLIFGLPFTCPLTSPLGSGLLSRLSPPSPPPSLSSPTPFPPNLWVLVLVTGLFQSIPPLLDIRLFGPFLREPSESVAPSRLSPSVVTPTVTLSISWGSRLLLTPVLGRIPTLLQLTFVAPAPSVTLPPWVSISEIFLPV